MLFPLNKLESNPSSFHFSDLQRREKARRRLDTTILYSSPYSFLISPILTFTSIIFSMTMRYLALKFHFLVNTQNSSVNNWLCGFHIFLKSIIFRRVQYTCYGFKYFKLQFVPCVLGLHMQWHTDMLCMSLFHPHWKNNNSNIVCILTNS